jgi:hypothetical protein
VKQATIEQIFNMFAEGKVNLHDFDQKTSYSLLNSHPQQQNFLQSSTDKLEKPHKLLNFEMAQSDK